MKPLPVIEINKRVEINGKNYDEIKPLETGVKYAMFYDVEVYPNFFGVTFKAYNHSSIFKFIIWHDANGNYVNNVVELRNFLRNRVKMIIGYNNKAYDDLFLATLLMHPVETEHARAICDSLYRLNVVIMNLQALKRDPAKRQQYRDRRKDLAGLIYAVNKLEYYKSLDILLMFNQIDRTTLKQLAVNMRWYNIQDLPIPPGSIIKKEDIEPMMKYNLNDVLIEEHVLINYRHDEFRLRVGLSNKYSMDFYDSCDTVIAKKIIRKFYCEETGVSYKEYDKGRTIRKVVRLANCISQRIRLYTREGQRLLEHMLKTTIKIDTEHGSKYERVAKEKKQFEHIYRSKYMSHTIGIGGIHSINKPEIITEDEDHLLIDIDATSFYPYLIVLERLYPAHMRPEFVQIYHNRIIKPRVEAKKSGDETGAKDLKITANATFGFTKAIDEPLYDPLIATSICVNGQLFLIQLMELIEKLTSGLIVYSNTDGITVKIPIGEYGMLLKLVKKWQQVTGLGVEMVRFKKMVLKDINNYIAFTYNPKKPVKAIGIFATDKPINKGFRYPVIAKALRGFYESGIPAEDTVRNCTEIHDFVSSQKINTRKFEMQLVQSASISMLQKTNRWVITRGNQYEGKLRKYNFSNNKTTAIERNHMITIVNLIESWMNPDTLKINHDFYIGECYKIIRSILPEDPRKHRVHQVEQLSFAL